MPSAINVLTNTPKISPHPRGDIFQIKFSENGEKNDKNTLIEILQVFGTLSHVDCERVLLEGAF